MYHHIYLINSVRSNFGFGQHAVQLISGLT